MTGPYIRQSLCSNLPLSGEDELVKGLPRAPTEGSNTHTPIPAALHALTLVLALAPSSNDELFQQFMKVYLENENQALSPTLI